MLRSHLHQTSFSFPLFGYPFKVMPNKNKLGIDGFLYMLREDYEQELKDYISFKDEGGVFLDIGANYGFWSRCVAIGNAEVGLHNYRVVAFEPFPTTFEILEANMALLPLDIISKVEFHRLAVGASNKTVKMSESNEEPGSSFISNDGIHSVNMIKLDSFCEVNNIHNVKLIKIDVEGLEHSVLEGAVNIISRDRPRVVCEIIEKYIIRAGYTSSDIYSFFKNYDYKCHLITNSGELLRSNDCQHEGNYYFLP